VDRVTLRVARVTNYIKTRDGDRNKLISTIINSLLR
jgi:hypothetical protein